MSKENPKSLTYIHLFIMGIILSVLFATISYAGYSRLVTVNDDRQKSHLNSQNLLEAQLKKQINLMTLKLDAISNSTKIPRVIASTNNPVSKQPDNKKQEIIIKHLSEQNKLISQILTHNDYLENEMKKNQEYC